MNQRDTLVRLTQDLIRLRSENPPGNEEAIASFAFRYLKGLGLKPRIWRFAKHRPNVVASISCPRAPFTLLISPHLDTVPAGLGWRYPAFGGKLVRGRIYGRGATDCKGNLAVSLEAMRSICEARIHLGYNLIFAATADEETGSQLGFLPLLKRGLIKPDAALILDADNFDIVVAQKGLLHLKIKFFGKKAHGAYPWRGINAIEKAVDFLKSIRALRFPHAPHPLLRGPTVNIGTIEGGDKVNIVADWAEVSLDIRFLPGMDKDTVLRKIKALLSCVSVPTRLEVENFHRPYEISASHPLVESLLLAHRELGIPAGLKGSEGATVMTFFQDYSIPAIATGVGTAGCAHTTDEYVKVKDLWQGKEVLVRFLSRLSNAVFFKFPTYGHGTQKRH